MVARATAVSATNVRGGDPAFGPERLRDDDPWSAWITDDHVWDASATFTFDAKTTFNVVRLREDIRLGQRIDHVTVAVQRKSGDGGWDPVVSTPYMDVRAVGPHRIWALPGEVRAAAVRVTVASRLNVSVALSDVGLFFQPALQYEALSGATHIGRYGWRVQGAWRPGGEPSKLFDGNPNTLWITANATLPSNVNVRNGTLPQAVTVVMPRKERFHGFTVLPQKGGAPGTNYRFEAGGRIVAEGEFGNVRNNPVEIDVLFPAGPVTTKIFRFTATAALGGDFAAMAELNLIADLPKNSTTEA